MSWLPQFIPENQYYYIVFKHPTTGRPYISSEVYTQEEINQIEHKEILKLIPIEELLHVKKR